MTTTTTAPLRQIADLPCPPGWPVLGNALQLTRSRVHQDVEGWARQHGKLFRMRFPGVTMLVVADHELLAQALRDRPEGWRRNPTTKTLSAEMGLPQGLFNAEGAAWAAQRRMVMASFAPGHIRAYFPQLLKVAQRLQNRWLRAANAGQALALQPELMRYTVDTIAGLALGADINTLEAGEDVIQQHLDKVLPAIFRRAFSLLPTWRWFKTRHDRVLDASVAVITTEIARFVALARAELEREPSLREHPRNLLQSMIVAAQAESGITDANVAGNVLTMLLAGEDTTANTLAWLIHLLHRHPECLARARNEAHAVLGAAAGRPGELTLEMMDTLPYLDACISETMRLKPVAPFISLQALRDTTLGDVQVPTGTLLWGVFRHDSMSEEHFPQALAFKPERWLDDGTAKGSNAKRVAMPFGAGPRMCPGRYLALLEMKVAMSMLLSGFNIESVLAPGGGEALEDMSFTMAPKGLVMRLAAGLISTQQREA